MDQANGFYRRRLTPRLGAVEVKVPRTRSGHSQTQVLVRDQRREPVIDGALRSVFLLGMTAETAAALRWLKERHCLLGIASNAQACNPRELKEALAAHAPDMDLFEHARFHRNR